MEEMILKFSRIFMLVIRRHEPFVEINISYITPPSTGTRCNSEFQSRSECHEKWAKIVTMAFDIAAARDFNVSKFQPFCFLLTHFVS